MPWNLKIMRFFFSIGEKARLVKLRKRKENKVFALFVCDLLLVGVVESQIKTEIRKSSSVVNIGWINHDYQ